MVRTRFAPSPTGSMHIGNLRTALYEYLLAKSNNGKFILRIEDTDQNRFVEGSVDIIYNTLKLAGIKYDEGPDIGGNYGPYIQSQRKNNYIKYAQQLINNNKAYYCFCSKSENNKNKNSKEISKYNRKCLALSKEEIENKLNSNTPYVIRQIIPSGTTTFKDEVYGEITINNDTLEDQILIKSDGLPTYNFANVIDDHLMNITHIVRGSEYLTSTPKYNLLYEALSWDIPIYVHLPSILNENGEKLSKRKGDSSFEDLIKLGFLPEAIVNYIALLGWSPRDNTEFFTLDELIKVFDIKGLSKSPSIFDMAKLTWMNGEYIKNLDSTVFYEMAYPYLKESIKREDVNLKKISVMVQSRVNFVKDITQLVDFIDRLPKYSTELYINKKMKTTEQISITSLEKTLELFKTIEGPFTEENIHSKLSTLIEELGIKKGQMLWPIRTALCGKPTSPCGAIELAELLGKEESVYRLEEGIKLLKNKVV